MPKINPLILTWARESAGLSVEEAAHAIGLAGEAAVERLREMEGGEREPSRRQIVKMAERYRRPLLTFYLSSPPEPAPRTHDFRTLPQREPGSEAIVDALVRDVKTRQALVRGALEDAEEATPLPFIGASTVEQGAAHLAQAIIGAIDFDRQAYRECRTVDDAFRLLRDRTEAAGIMVLIAGNLGHHATNLSPAVFRGMALADEIAPFVVINETDARSAWPFTLLHEVAHILLGQSGISGYDSEQRVEKLCDDAAAKVLVDAVELQQIDTTADFDDLVAQVGAFARSRKVSRKMVAYNMYRAGLIEVARYRQLAARFDEDRIEYQRRNGPGAPDYYVVRRHRAGAGLLQLVHRMVREGTLTTVKAGKVLGVKPTAVGRMTERVA